jgi:SAM-dependent methyltransferase
MDITSHNRAAWNRNVSQGNRWTVPVSASEVAAARDGHWSVQLTPTIPVPRSWFPATLTGCRVLGLASAGGQQGPIFAATGAVVTVLDLSPAQLDRDREVATREALVLDAVEGDMADLSRFPDASFDLVFHPVSNCFVSDIRPVWQEAFRVLRPGGVLLAGFCNPLIYLFSEDREGNLDKTLRYRVPHADPDVLSAEELARFAAEHIPLEFGHTLEQQLGGQLRAGFLLTDLYEDCFDQPDHPLNAHSPSFIATRAVKPMEPNDVRLCP